MTRGKRITQDQQLANGSIVFWSQRLEQYGCSYVPVRCGLCGQQRIVSTSGIHVGFNGICRECSTAARRTIQHTGEEVLPNGSIIYWDDEQYDERYPTDRRIVTVRCGGKYCGGSTRQVPVHIAAEDGFTGLCRRCAHYGSASGRWKGGKKKNLQGYVLVKLAPDHPFYCMADKNGYVLGHRLVMAEKLGRPLQRKEIVHHINGKKDDNRLENLELLVKHDHPGYHSMPDEESGLWAWLKRRVLRR